MDLSEVDLTKPHNKQTLSNRQLRLAPANIGCPRPGSWIAGMEVLSRRQALSNYP